MIVYSKEEFIRAHENISIPHRNHSYDRYVKQAICSCGKFIGELVRYPDFDKEFRYKDDDINEWKYCPYCNEKLIKD